MENDCKTYKEELSRKIYLTKSVRFRAFDRLSKLHKLFSISTSFLSSYLIIISLIGIYLRSVQNTYAAIIPYVVVAIALILLVFNLTESSKEYKLNAEKMHNCARELTRLHLKLNYICNSGINNHEEELLEYREVSKQYATILEKYEGHSSKDFNIFKVINRESMEKMYGDKYIIPWYKVIEYQWDYHFHQFVKYWILLYVPIPLIILLLVTYI